MFWLNDGKQDVLFQINVFKCQKYIIVSTLFFFSLSIKNACLVVEVAEFHCFHWETSGVSACSFFCLRFFSRLLVWSESSLAPRWRCWGKHGWLHFISGWVSSLASDWLNLWSQHTLSCVLLFCNKGPRLFLEVREIPLKLSKTLVLVHTQYHSHIYQLDHNPVACTIQLEKPDQVPPLWLVFFLRAALTWTP